MQHPQEAEKRAIAEATIAKKIRIIELCGRFEAELKYLLLHLEREKIVELLGRCHVCGMAWGRSGAWAARCGEKSGGGGDKGDFHGFSQVDLNFFAFGSSQLNGRLTMALTAARQKTRLSPLVRVTNAVIEMHLSL